MLDFIAILIWSTQAKTLTKITIDTSYNIFLIHMAGALLVENKSIFYTTHNSLIWGIRAAVLCVKYDNF